MQKIGIFYGSTTGNTEGVAKQIQQELGADCCQLFDVSKAKAEDIAQFSNLLFGTSTWGVGDLLDDFEGFISTLRGVNLEGKTVALFGCGDQESYSDSFVDGIGQIWDAIKDNGCTLVGTTSKEDYSYYESRAEVGGELIGLAIDEDNQGNLTSNRIKQWVESIKPHLQ